MRWRGIVHVGTPSRKSPGFTTLELLMSLSLLAMAFVGLAGLGQTAIRATRVQEARLDVQQAARRGLDRITDELRWAETVLPDPQCGSGLCPDRVTIRIPAGNPYRRDASYAATFQHNSAQRELERRLGLGVNNLASFIDRVEFRYLDANGAPVSDPGAVARIAVALVAQTPDGPVVVVESTVALRNFRHPRRRAPSPTPVWRPAPQWLRPPGPRSGGGPPHGAVPAAW